jgi:site-specific DNA-cytosine methylase
MKILVACEYSGAVRSLLRAKGHDAWSCDLLEAEDGSPYHYQTDVRELLKEDWDAVIAFPPCTDLAVSGARWFPEKRADGRQQASIEFFLLFTQLDCPKVVIENPIGIMSRATTSPTYQYCSWP